MAVTVQPSRTASKEVLATLTYTGQAQDPVRLTRGQIIHALNLYLTLQYDVTGDTANKHPAGVANLIKQIEIATNNGKVIHRLSGQDLYELFAKDMGVAGDNADLHVGGGVANNQVAYQHIKFPFYLNDGQRPDDGCLQTFTQDVVIKVEWNTPTAAGTLYGTATGLVIDSLELKLELDTWRCSKAEEDAFLKGLERSIVTQDIAITQTNDALQLKDLPVNEMYRKVTFLPRSTTNNMTQGSAAIIVPTKELAVKKTFENTVIQRGLVRGFRSDTLRARQDASFATGAFEVNFLRFGSMKDFMPSTQSSELFFELPVSATGTAPFVRIVSDIVRNQA